MSRAVSLVVWFKHLAVPLERFRLQLNRPFAVALLVLAVSGCGVKGPLEPPPPSEKPAPWSIFR